MASCRCVAAFFTVTLLFLDSAYAIDCPDGMKKYIHPDGTEDCIFCTDCPRGYVKKENCSIRSDTVCEKCPKETFYVDTEPNCIHCTECEPGQKIAKNCSQFEDNRCEACPEGKFSPNQNSYECKACSSCEGKDVDRPCTPSTDIVCKDHNYTLAIVLVCILAVAIICIICVYLLWKRRKRNKQEAGPEESALMRTEGTDPAKEGENRTSSLQLSEEDIKEKEKREAREKAEKEARKALEEFRLKMKKQMKQLQQLAKDDQFEKIGFSIGELIFKNCQGTTSEHISMLGNEDYDTQSSGNGSDSKKDCGETTPANKEENYDLKEQRKSVYSEKSVSSQQGQCDNGEKQTPMTDQQATDSEPEEHKPKEMDRLVIKEKSGKRVPEASKKDKKSKSETLSYVPVKKKKRLRLMKHLKRGLKIEKKIFYNEKEMKRCFGVFVGSKYFMTSHHSVKQLQDRQADEDIVIRFSAKEQEGDDRLIEEICAVSPVPLYTNEDLDVAILKISEPLSLPSPINLCKDFSYGESEIVTLHNNTIMPIRLLTGQEKEKRDFDEFYNKKDDTLDSNLAEQDGAENDNKGNAADSTSELKDNIASGNPGSLASGKINAAKVFWEGEKFVGAGSPCFFFDKNDNIVQLFCMSNFPKFYFSLAEKDKESLNKYFKIQFGTNMSGLYNDLSVSNQMLCQELFV